MKWPQRSSHLSFSSTSSLSSLSPLLQTPSLPTAPSRSGTQKLISDGGDYALGFFQPGSSSPKKQYIGIWYNKVSKLTPVWVANREAPISDPSSSKLQISGDGNLVLVNQSGDIVWSTNASISGRRSSSVAVLLDTGNLVLRDSSNSSVVHWQSFDYPSHTWLPGNKLSRNKTTGVSQRLISWTNQEDPAPGIFSLLIDPDGSSQYIIQWNKSRQYWSSGLWNGDIFSGVPEMTRNYIYSFEYIDNSYENYFTYTVNTTAIITRFIMDFNGQIKQLNWFPSSGEWIQFWSQPRAQCQVYALCGSFGICDDTNQNYCTCVQGFDEKSLSDWDLGDRTSGCKRNIPLNCGGNSSSTSGGEKDKFLLMPNIGLPDNPSSVAGIGSSTACEADCLSNCSCVAYSFSNGQCSIWYGELLNLEASGSNTLYLRLAASELPSPKSMKGVIAGAVAGGLAAIVGLAGLVWFLLWRRRRSRLLSATKAVAEGALVSFRYGDLVRATKNFAEKLGGGGFGMVFKGTLPDSTFVAVKRLEGIRQGEKQFRTEVSTIGTIQHVNLVRLRGFCSEADKRLLVYEFMPKGSLDSQLFPGGSSAVLDWKMRYQIATGTARGLVYLHEKCRDCIIHCDIKPENILLDSSYVPKVADFGLAKLVGRDFSRVLTTMRGTRGYLAPEWISGLAITAKADVYSYGMMLFEIISGRRNSDSSGEVKTTFFPKLAAAKLMEGDVLSLLDPKLGGDANLEELARACKVAFWCIQDDENLRPTMGQVVQILECVVDVDMPQIPRSLQIFADNAEDIVFFSDLSSNQSSHTRSTFSTTSQVPSTSSMTSRD